MRGTDLCVDGNHVFVIFNEWKEDSRKQAETKSEEDQKVTKQVVWKEACVVLKQFTMRSVIQVFIRSYFCSAGRHCITAQNETHMKLLTTRLWIVLGNTTEQLW